jgi:hypothetical protein
LVFETPSCVGALVVVGGTAKDDVDDEGTDSDIEDDPTPGTRDSGKEGGGMSCESDKILGIPLDVDLDVELDDGLVLEEILCALEVAGKAGGMSLSSFSVSDPSLSPSIASSVMETFGLASEDVVSLDEVSGFRLHGNQLLIYAAMTRREKGCERFYPE